MITFCNDYGLAVLVYSITREQKLPYLGVGRARRTDEFGDAVRIQNVHTTFYVNALSRLCHIDSSAIATYLGTLVILLEPPVIPESVSLAGSTRLTLAYQN